MATSNIPLRRLRQTTNHLQVTAHDEFANLSIVHGPSSPPLITITLGELIDTQNEIRGDKECLIVPWTGARWTYSDLHTQSRILAKSMLAMGLRRGDRVGILGCNCEEYVAAFFAAGYIGCILVVLNSTYTAQEAHQALKHSGCKVLFAEKKYDRHVNTQLLKELDVDLGEDNELEQVIMLRGSFGHFAEYADIMEIGRTQVSDEILNHARDDVHPHDVVNLQFTSGSTGNPKAAMLTHHNLINNSRSIGDRMSFTASDILCCPPPLFHCFGLVLGVLACLTHGATVVLPSPTFNAKAVLSALSAENCTALHGVPAMFEELLSLPRPDDWSCPNLRTGIVAGAPVPRPLMERMLSELNMSEFTSSYGLTEASPTCFNATTYDSIHRRLTTVGKILPHLHAKIIDREGNIVPIGTHGELCMAGYSLQKGYYKNRAKTDEVMIRDEQGILWLHTGDEAVFDVHGYCTITGRFKDIIIRGGENIYPVEIESRLVAHPSNTIARAAVVGIKHVKYGEVVGAFLLPSPSPDGKGERPTDDELRVWVRQVLGRHKAPAHIFWFGDERVGMDEVPQTGSGKVKKHVLRDVAQDLVSSGA
ncbi:AMP-binding enzyme [Phlyctema vagabunda]|uniref:AMP-binding enzyme n=1 Tax=Phlyctema vagabunda TaxID=108571 RepID=A0ABR4P876_9HELO